MPVALVHYLEDFLPLVRSHLGDSGLIDIFESMPSSFDEGSYRQWLAERNIEDLSTASQEIFPMRPVKVRDEVDRAHFLPLLDNLIDEMRQRVCATMRFCRKHELRCAYRVPPELDLRADFINDILILRGYCRIAIFK